MKYTDCRYSGRIIYERLFSCVLTKVSGILHLDFSKADKVNARDVITEITLMRIKSHKLIYNSKKTSTQLESFFEQECDLRFVRRRREITPITVMHILFFFHLSHRQRMCIITDGATLTPAIYLLSHTVLGGGFRIRWLRRHANYLHNRSWG